MWADLALGLEHHGNIATVGETAAVTPVMIGTMRRSRHRLDAILKNLREHGETEVAARIDWPEDVRRNASRGAQIGGIAECIAMRVVAAPVMLVTSPQLLPFVLLPIPMGP